MQAGAGNKLLFALGGVWGLGEALRPISIRHPTYYTQLVVQYTLVFLSQKIRVVIKRRCQEAGCFRWVLVA